MSASFLESPSSDGRCVVLAGARHSAAAGVSERLLEAGYHVLLVEDLPTDDRGAVARLVAAHSNLPAAVDRARVASLGFGAAGTQAFLAACARDDAACVVVVSGRLWFEELSPAHPSQPLELALNLSCPVLLVAGDSDAELPEADRARAADVLSQFFRTFDIVTRPGDGTTALEDEAAAALLSFLDENL